MPAKIRKRGQQETQLSDVAFHAQKKQRIHSEEDGDLQQLIEREDRASMQILIQHQLNLQSVFKLWQTSIQQNLSRQCLQICDFRLKQYLKYQCQCPSDNNILYWKKLVAAYFVSHAKKKWCLSSCNPAEHSTLGIFSDAVMQDTLHCNLCCSGKGRGLETSVDSLPELMKAEYDRGLVEEHLSIETPYGHVLSSGLMVLGYLNATQECVYENFVVIQKGQLCVTFTPSLKILEWEFCIQKHELCHRQTKHQGNQSVHAAQKYQNGTAESGPTESLCQDSQADCKSFSNPEPQLKNGLSPEVNDMGFSRDKTRSLQLSENISSVKDLMYLCKEDNIRAVETMKKCHQLAVAANLEIPNMDRGQFSDAQGSPVNQNTNPTERPIHHGSSSRVSKTGCKVNIPPKTAVAPCSYQDLQNYVNSCNNHRQAAAANIQIPNADRGEFSEFQGLQMDQNTCSKESASNHSSSGCLTKMSEKAVNIPPQLAATSIKNFIKSRYIQQKAAATNHQIPNMDAWKSSMFQGSSVGENANYKAEENTSYKGKEILHDSNSHLNMKGKAMNVPILKTADLYNCQNSQGNFNYQAASANHQIRIMDTGQYSQSHHLSADRNANYKVNASHHISSSHLGEMCGNVLNNPIPQTADSCNYQDLKMKFINSRLNASQMEAPTSFSGPGSLQPSPICIQIDDDQEASCSFIGQNSREAPPSRFNDPQMEPSCSTYNQNPPSASPCHLEPASNRQNLHCSPMDANLNALDAPSSSNDPSSSIAPPLDHPADPTLPPVQNGSTNGPESSHHQGLHLHQQMQEQFLGPIKPWQNHMIPQNPLKTMAAHREEQSLTEQTATPVQSGYEIEDTFENVASTVPSRNDSSGANACEYPIPFDCYIPSLPDVDIDSIWEGLIEDQCGNAEKEGEGV